MPGGHHSGNNTFGTEYGVSDSKVSCLLSLAVTPLCWVLVHVYATDLLASLDQPQGQLCCHRTLPHSTLPRQH